MGGSIARLKTDHQLIGFNFISYLLLLFCKSTISKKKYCTATDHIPSKYLQIEWKRAIQQISPYYIFGPLKLTFWSHILKLSYLNYFFLFKACDILWGVWKFSGSGCTNSGEEMKYSAVFYIPAEYFISHPELVQPEQENCHSPRGISGAFFLWCWPNFSGSWSNWGKT